jgi:hypothetical protein
MTQIIKKCATPESGQNLNCLASSWFHYWLRKHGQYEDKSSMGRIGTMWPEERTNLPILIGQVMQYIELSEKHQVEWIGYDCGPGWQLYDIGYAFTKGSTHECILVIDDDVEAVEFKLIMG